MVTIRGWDRYGRGEKRVSSARSVIMVVFVRSSGCEVHA